MDHISFCHCSDGRVPIYYAVIIMQDLYGKGEPARQRRKFSTSAHLEDEESVAVSEKPVPCRQRAIRY